MCFDKQARNPRMLVIREKKLGMRERKSEDEKIKKKKKKDWDRVENERARFLDSCTTQSTLTLYRLLHLLMDIYARSSPSAKGKKLKRRENIFLSLGLSDFRDFCNAVISANPPVRIYISRVFFFFVI